MSFDRRALHLNWILPTFRKSIGFPADKAQQQPSKAYAVFGCCTCKFAACCSIHLSSKGPLRESKGPAAGPANMPFAVARSTERNKPPCTAGGACASLGSRLACPRLKRSSEAWGAPCLVPRDACHSWVRACWACCMRHSRQSPWSSLLSRSFVSWILAATSTCTNCARCPASVSIGGEPSAAHHQEVFEPQTLP